MPIEKRQILLSSEELVHAIEAYRNVNPTFLPQGDLLKAEVGPGTEAHAPADVEVTVSICMRYGDRKHRVDLTIPTADIVSLLIRFCLENNVPVPRLGTKAAALMNGALALRIEYTH